MNKIKFYKVRGRGNDPRHIFVYFPDEPWEVASGYGYKSSYAPIGQHGPVDPRFVEESCQEITKEEYMKVLGGLYTPKEYLQ